MDEMTPPTLPEPIPGSVPPTTPPNPSPEYATFGVRLGARLLDMLVTLAVCAVGGAVAFAVTTADNQGATTSALVAYLAAVQVGAAIALYFLLGYSKDRRTVGYAAVGLALRRTDGQPVGFWQTFGRWLLSVLSGLLLGLGYLAPLWTEKRQTFHDSLANTVVIRDSNKGRGVAAALAWFVTLTLAQGVAGGLIGQNLIDDQEAVVYEDATRFPGEGEAEPTWDEGTNECSDEDSGQFTIDVNGVVGTLQPTISLDINDTCGSRREFTKGWVFFTDEYGCEGSGTFEFDDGLRIAPYDTVTVSFEFVEMDCTPASGARVRIQLREAALTTSGFSPSRMSMVSSGPADISNPFDRSPTTQVTEPERTASGPSVQLVPASVYAPTAADPEECAGEVGSYSAENLTDGDLSTKWAYESDMAGRRFEFEFAQPVHLTSVALAGFGTGSCGTLGGDDFRSITGVRWTFDDGSVVRHNPTSSDGLDSISVDVVTSTVTMDVTSTEPGLDGLQSSFVSEVSFEGQDTDEVPNVPEIDGRACDPPEQIGHGTELENLENDKFQIVVCENGGELLYFGHSKGDLGSIVLEAETTSYGYVARNGVYAYEVSTGDSASLRVARGDEELTYQELAEAG